MISFLRSLLFAIGQVTSLLLFTPVALLAWFLPSVPRARVIGLWARFIVRWLRITCNLGYRVRGLENLPPVPSVVLSKHQSAWETIAFQDFLPPHSYILKRELLWIPFFGWGLAANRPIVIDRSHKVRALDKVISEGRERLREGRWVVVFPEGTRMLPGERGRYQAGGALMAVKAGAPVVPIAHNAGLFWPRHSFLKRPGTIDVIIGPPIETRGRKARQVNHEAEEWIEKTMETLAPWRTPS